MIANTIGVLIAVVIFSGPLCAQDIAFNTSRKGDSFVLEGRATLSVSRRVVWQVLTDYERLPEFVPGLHRSRIVMRAGNRLLLEQHGELRVLFFSVPIEIRLEVEERFPDVIVSRSVAGSVRSMSGRYDLVESGDGTEFRYRGDVVADFGLPRFIGEFVLRSYAEAQFSALVREIVRRGTRTDVQ